MSDATNGSLGWVDLTVDAAPTLRDFYATVAGWEPEAHDMGDYSDYVMKAADGTPVAGVCHRRGDNADMPPVWMIYIVVPDMNAAADLVEANGGAVLERRSQFVVIRDPAGAVCALYQKG